MKISELPEEVREKALEYKRNKNTDILIDAFDWENTEEGHDYWEEWHVKKPDTNSKEYDFINPTHYKQFSKETIEMMVDIYGKEKVAIYCELNAFKYKMRAGSKPEQSIERDIEKANWYLNKRKELIKI